MLSVKHIMPNGREIVRLVEKVEFDPVSSRAAKSSEDCDYIFIWVGRDFPERIEVGTVYVMNENGKTVATYKLGNGNAKIAHDRLYVKASPEDANALRQCLAEWHKRPLEAISLQDASGRPDLLSRTLAGHMAPNAHAGGGKISWGDGGGEATQESGCISAPANTAGIR